uniref:hypothetical protein n=1 Tax=Piscirickettsia salmonis TaxID=1238 RepID=UPI0039F6C0E2
MSSYSDKIAVLEWAKNPELYIKHYEIRHGTAWENSILIAELDSTTLHLTHARPGFYLIKAVSQWGIKSAEASVSVATSVGILHIQ